MLKIKNSNIFADDIQTTVDFLFKKGEPLKTELELLRCKSDPRK
jgi:hypothetical protein